MNTPNPFADLPERKKGSDPFADLPEARGRGKPFNPHLKPLVDIPAVARGLGRSLTDWKEAALQLLTQGGPGEVWGRAPWANPKGTITPEMAIRMVEQENPSRPLSAAEKERLRREPDIAWELSRFRKEQALAQKRHEFTRDEPTEAQVGRGAGNILPWLLLRTPAKLAQMPGLGGLASRTGYYGATGAGIGASQFVERGQDRGENAAYMGLGSAALGGGLDFVRNFVMPTRNLARETGIQQALKLPEAKKGLRLTRDTGQDFKLSQVLGSERLAGAEREAAAARPDIAKPDTNRMISQFMNRLEGIQKLVDPKHSTPGRTAKAVLPAYQAELQRTLDTRSTMFTERLAEAEKLVKGKPVIPTEPIIQELQAELKAATVAVQSDLTGKYVGKLRMEIDKLAPTLRPGGKILGPDGQPLISPSAVEQKLTITNVQRLLEDYGKSGRGSGRVLDDVNSAADRRVYQTLKKAMKNALDRAGDDATLGPAAAVLKSAREDYKLLSQYKDELGSTSLGALLNKKNWKQGIKPTDEDILNAVRKMKPSEARNVLPILEKHNPDLIGALQRNYFRDILKRSGAGDAATAGVHPVNMRKFANNWQTDDYFRALFRDRQTRHELIRARQALRRLADEQPPKHAPGTVEKRTEEAGIAGSGNITFIFRMISRRITPTKLAKLLHTPEGRMALIRAAEPAHYTPSEIAASIGYLNRIDAEAEPPP